MGDGGGGLGDGGGGLGDGGSGCGGEGGVARYPQDHVPFTVEAFPVRAIAAPVLASSTLAMKAYGPTELRRLRERQCEPTLPSDTLNTV